MNNVYKKHINRSAEKKDTFLGPTALAVLLLHHAPHYWHGHPNLEDIE